MDLWRHRPFFFFVMAALWHSVLHSICVSVAFPFAEGDPLPPHVRNSKLPDPENFQILLEIVFVKCTRHSLNSMRSRKVLFVKHQGNVVQLWVCSAVGNDSGRREAER